MQSGTFSERFLYDFTGRDGLRQQRRWEPGMERGVWRKTTA